MAQKSMNNPIVSIIIPVHNTEPFLRECLDSVINQTLKEIEIICVNDGSTDQSLAILEEYAGKDNRVKIICQGNKGGGAARNAGLAVASGEYLAFLDSDDFLVLEMLEKVYTLAVKRNVDIVVYNSFSFDNVSKECKIGPYPPLYKDNLPDKPVFSYLDMPTNIFDTLGTLVWNKLFKRDFICKHDIRFQEIQRSNDIFFSFSALMAAERITVSFEPLLFYRKGLKNNCQSTNHNAPLDFYDAINAFGQRLLETEQYQIVEKWFLNFLLGSSIYNLSSLKHAEAFGIVYNAIKNDLLLRFKVAEKNEDYFYIPNRYKEMKKILSMSVIEYLFDQRDTARKERDQLRKERDLLQKKKHVMRTWQDRENELDFSFKNGERRIALLSRYISPKDKSVIDLGAGNLFLASILPKEVSYYPVDYKLRSNNTIICDFNKREFPEISIDVVFISGTLEFVQEPEWLLTKAAKYASKIILSYNAVLENTQANIEQRRKKAWQNDLTRDDIINIMHSKGFLLDKGNPGPVLRGESFFCFLKATPWTLRKNYFCPGCGACTNICHVGALRIEPDENGLYRPMLNAEKCIGCGKCVRVCPVINPLKNEKAITPKCFEFIANDNELLYRSSSGGVFPLMAKKILQNGGMVCGVAWREDFSVEHIMIDSESDLHKLQKSKYIQSDVGYIHRQVKAKLEAGRAVLFSGSPCHVAGLQAFLNKLYDNLYCIDLLCGKAPSASLFRKYLKDTFGEKKVHCYEFRNKTRGWNADAHMVTFTDGTMSVRRKANDPFQRVYHDPMMRPNACAWCRFSLIPRPADVTIGDFWGIDKNDKDINPNYKNGTSAVLINNDKGKKLFEAIINEGQVVKEVPLKWLGTNGAVFQARRGTPNEMRDKFSRFIKKFPFPKTVDAITNKHFDIGIVGWWDGWNFGGQLSYYAFHQVLVNMGYSVFMIGELKKYKDPNKKFEDFFEKHYFHIPPDHFNDLKQYNSLCETFMVGSDQQWNYRGRFIKEEFFLNFVDSDKKKISFATSFGNKEHAPPHDIKDRYSFLLQQFDAISVREDYAVDVAKNIYNVDAVQVLDPVFLLTADEYRDLEEDANFRPVGDFLVAYILNGTPAKRDIVCEIARRLNLEVIVIPDVGKTRRNDLVTQKVFSGMITLEDLSPENFIYAFNRCKYVVTDSLHGTCFTYIFKKNFSVFYNRVRGSDRFDSLMRMINLQERQIFEDHGTNGINDKMLQPVDFSYADTQIKAMREKSIVWLKSALGKHKLIS